MKRAFDIVVSAAMLLVLAPVMLLMTLLVRLKLGRPVLFAQERPGRAGRLFRLYKFRTMNDERDGEGSLCPDEERLGRFGRTLRSTSLDELPELWNVLKGDMSLVGPRPLLVEYLERYTPEQARRHELRPGITGLAQVRGRNALSWEERFDLDVWYVDNRSLSLDAKILLETVSAVLGRKGIAQDGQATMSRFTGSPGKDAGDR
jgi:sugar transferase EpsL